MKPVGSEELKFLDLSWSDASGPHSLKKCIKVIGINFSYNRTLVNKEKHYDLAINCRALLNIWK